jgi:hypothetical protein
MGLAGGIGAAAALTARRIPCGREICRPGRVNPLKLLAKLSFTREFFECGTGKREREAGNDNGAITEI